MVHDPRILLIDDDDGSRALLRMLIEAKWPNTILTEVSDALIMARAMRQPTQDLCIVDPERSWAASNELLQMLVDDELTGPVVVYSPIDRAEPAIQAIQSGAAAYIVKNQHGPIQLLKELVRWLGPGKSSPEKSTDPNWTQSLAMISHDLQEPIRAIHTYLDVLQQKHGKELTADGIQLLAKAKQATQRASESLVSTIDDLRETPEPLPHFPQAELPLLDLDEDEESVECTTAWNKDVVRFPEVVTNSNAVLDETLEILAPVISQEQADVHRTSLAPVAIQSNHLRRILQNLISNALKFRGEANPHITVSTQESDDRVQFSVEDNGIGIAEEDHEKIFQMFTRLSDGTEFPGTGIGLAAAKNLVESYGGNIKVESKKGEGSRFIFTLPSVPGARVRASRRSQP